MASLVPNDVSLQSQPGPRRVKRLKIDVACDTCRSRKVKCDGVRPACGNCSKKFGQKDNCHYSNDDSVPMQPLQPPPPPPPTKEILPNYSTPPNGLNKQPSHLNTTNATSPPRDTSHGQQRNHHAPYPIPTTHPLNPTLRPVISHVSPGRTLPITKSVLPKAGKPSGTSDSGSLPATDASPSVIDSMTAVIDEGTSTGEFFGSSSAGSFTAQIKNAISSRLGQSQTKSNHSDSGIGTGPSNTAKRQGLNTSVNYVLPPRRQADHLMHVYWFYVDPLYPLLDRRKWEQNYANLFTGTSLDTDESIFVATLNVIFALSTQLVESMEAESRDETSDAYIKRSKDLLDLNFWDSGSIELVQYLLLMGQYLQSTSLPHQTWMIVGSSVRVAQSLGLHLPETSAAQSTPGQREILRRIWHGCVLMDRVVSLTHGRPAMISQHLATAVPLPATSATAQPAEYGHLTEGSFFVKSIELYEITHRVILDLYPEPGSRPRSTLPNDKEQDDLATVMQLDAAMMKWEESLPRFLVLSDPDVAKNEVSHRQAVILHIRFLHARMLHLRPILARVCLPHPGTSPTYTQSKDSLQFRVMQQCAICCVDIARNIISSLLKYQACDGTVGLLPAWWYRVYYLFSAATVLIAAKLRTDIFDPQEINHAWTDAMKVLEAHEHVSESARRCVAGLQILSSKILQGAPPPHKTMDRDNASVPAAHSNNMPPLMHMSADDDGQMYSPTTAQGQQPHGLQQFQELDMRGLTFTVDDFSWLNDMNAWNVLNDL